MKHRNFRIAWSVAWGVVAVLLCVLWVRSYWWEDIVFGPSTPPKYFIVSSLFGKVYWEESEIIGSTTTSIELDVRNIAEYGMTNEEFLDAQIPWPENNVSYAVMVLLSATLAAIPWLRYFPRRFSLRTLLIATTLVAVGLGLVVWMSRAG